MSLIFLHLYFLCLRFVLYFYLIVIPLYILLETPYIYIYTKRTSISDVFRSRKIKASSLRLYERQNAREHQIDSLGERPAKHRTSKSPKATALCNSITGYKQHVETMHILLFHHVPSFSFLAHATIFPPFHPPPKGGGQRRRVKATCKKQKRSCVSRPVTLILAAKLALVFEIVFRRSEETPCKVIFEKLGLILCCWGRCLHLLIASKLGSFPKALVLRRSRRYDIMTPF